MRLFLGAVNSTPCSCSLRIARVQPNIIAKQTHTNSHIMRSPPKHVCVARIYIYIRHRSYAISLPWTRRWRLAPRCGASRRKRVELKRESRTWINAFAAAGTPVTWVSEVKSSRVFVWVGGGVCGKGFWHMCNVWRFRCEHAEELHK